MNGRVAKEFRRQAYGGLSIRAPRQYGRPTKYAQTTIVAVSNRGIYKMFKQRYKALRRFGVYEQTTKIRFHAQRGLVKKIQEELEKLWDPSQINVNGVAPK